MLKLKEIILKYPEDDAITLRSVFCTGIMERWILSLSLIYYELLVWLTNSHFQFRLGIDLIMPLTLELCIKHFRSC